MNYRKPAEMQSTPNKRPIHSLARMRTTHSRGKYEQFFPKIYNSQILKSGCQFDFQAQKSKYSKKKNLHRNTK